MTFAQCKGESNIGSEARQCTHRYTRARTGFRVVNILDGLDLLSSSEVYSGIVQYNPSSRRIVAAKGQPLARDGYMVS